MSRSGDDATAVFEMAMGRAVYASRPMAISKTAVASSPLLDISK